MGRADSAADRRLSTRSRISLADLLVKVIARIDSGATPLLIISAIRSVMTLVLPAPAPAIIIKGPLWYKDASFCFWFNPSKAFGMSPMLTSGGY